MPYVSVKSVNSLGFYYKLQGGCPPVSTIFVTNNYQNDKFWTAEMQSVPTAGTRCAIRWHTPCQWLAHFFTFIPKMSQLVKINQFGAQKNFWRAD